jgi:hypothetical protein
MLIRLILVVMSLVILSSCRTSRFKGELQQAEETEHQLKLPSTLGLLLSAIPYQEQSIDSLFKKFVGDDPEARKRILLVYKSRSPLPATIETPRVISYSKDAGIVVSAAASVVEVMEFDEAQGRFRFHKISFGDNGKGVLKVQADDPSCRSCHSFNGRPVWDGASGWPGFYGSISNSLQIYDPNHQNNPDGLGARGKGVPSDSHPDFKQAEWHSLNRFVWEVQGGYRSRPVYRNFDLGEVEGRANLHFIKIANRNAEFGGLLTRLQARQILADLSRGRSEDELLRIMNTFLYIARKAVIGGDIQPSSRELAIAPDPDGQEFEASISNGGNRREDFERFLDGVAEAQRTYEENFFQRQYNVFKYASGRDLTGGSDAKVRASFKPIVAERAEAIVTYYAKLQMYLRSKGVDVRYLSPIAIGDQNLDSINRSDKAQALEADGRGIFQIGTLGTIFDLICSEWAGRVPEEHKPARCYSGVLPSN